MIQDRVRKDLDKGVEVPMGLTNYEAADLLINAIIGIGTLAAVGVTVFLYVKDVSRKRLERRAIRIEAFIVPALKTLRQIERVLNYSDDTFRPSLVEDVNDLEELAVDNSHRVDSTLDGLLEDLLLVSHQGTLFAKGLTKLRLRQNARLDRLGSRLSGDAARKEWPKLALIGDNGRLLAEMNGGRLLEMWIRNFDFHGWLSFYNDDYKQGPFSVHMVHGQQEIKVEDPKSFFVQTLRSVMREDSDLADLPKSFENLMKEVRKVREKVFKVLQQERKALAGL